MKKTLGLQIASSTVGLLLISTTYMAVRSKQRNQIATKLLAVLENKLDPARKGIENEDALKIHYADKVLRRLSGKVIVLKKTTAIRLAQQIHQGFRPWYMGGDKEEAVYAILRQLKDKVQVSQVAKAYQDTYNISLQEQLQDRFDKAEITKALRIIARLPDYRTL